MMQETFHNLFKPIYEAAFQCGFGTGFFKAYVELRFSEEVWHDLKPAHDYVASIYNALLTELAIKMQTLWKSSIDIDCPSDDDKRIERYGDLMGTDFNFGVQLNASMWLSIAEADRKEITDMIEKHHELIYKKYKEFYRGNDKYAN